VTTSRTALNGLTWNHPRGYVVLDALAAEDGPGGTAVRWDRQPLEGFESTPLRTLADRYDLLVIDHPGLGEAVGDRALRPLGTLLPEEELAGWAAVSAGRSFASYRLAGQQWALPLDAAAQVSVGRPGRLDERPSTWDEAVCAAGRYPSVVCLGGPHALLMFCSICVALGAPPAADPGTAAAGRDGGFADRQAGREALAVMARLFGHGRPFYSEKANPIAVLNSMAAGDGSGPVYCPLVYGYISYQGRLAAFDAPAGPAGIGSVLGGTGIAVTRSCARLDEAAALIRLLLSPGVQIGRYAELGGQSADRRAWRDPAADRRAGGFYSATGRTIEAAWVRPRYAGYIPFQSAASAVLREGLERDDDHDDLLDRVDKLFAGTASPAEATTRRSG